MKRDLFSHCLIAALVLLMWTPSVGQQSYFLAGNQQFTVSGTSSIHDWDMNAKDDINGTAQLTIESGKLTKIQSLSIDLPVKSLKSGKGSMDNNAYEALTVKKYPSIKFEMTELTSISGNVVKVKGKVTIAGTTKIIPLEVIYSLNGSTIKFKGTQDILFSDFNVKPPTAVFGTIKTGNELTLAFEASFSPKN
ncbi:YceI-like domain-containing protein [Algoriphagus ratkowskyi]|uniref:YceI family protein n=1 Tax=Algoriphagus ratkowskyi TaxID=57028 RepID=A0A2W7RUF2_9BACT|nr:YceI family protein [Algoriphagus ratkowskyi]PZX58259.1 YceI-like domain-containing protein [Algoriphagus ratkowskyi]TXD77862.1 YceI family protein [Algoriphagus ratkowskyi]